nr:phage antirepressor KilAC domain-containing protein [Brevibacillus laterosporus]
MLDAPKVEFHDTFVNADYDTLTIEQVSKSLGVGLIKFYEFLRWGKVFYKDKSKNLPKQQYIDDGSFLSGPYTYKKIVNNKEVTRNAVKILVTPKGVKRIGKFFKKNYDRFLEIRQSQTKSILSGF